MHIHAGTSGFSYDEWRGTFYPADLPANGMLGYYSARLATVEVNNTFYQMPKPELFERWRDLVPGEFRFALKAPRRITHVQRLKDAAESVGRFGAVASVLGEKLGPVLFQLPPFAKQDIALLREFFSVLPAGLRVAFEFRNASWFDDATYAVLSEHGAALCAGDADDGDRSPPLVATADFGYLRLRAPSYDAALLGSWRERIQSQRWSDAFVYFKHEVHGPAYALYLVALLGGKELPELPVALPAASEAPAPKRGKSKRTAPAGASPRATKPEPDAATPPAKARAKRRSPPPRS